MLPAKLNTLLAGVLVLASNSLLPGVQGQVTCPRCRAGGCPDGTRCRVNDFCCATGPCDALCRNCHGRCRTSGGLQQEVMEHDPVGSYCNNEAAVHDHDINGDGVITFIEWVTSMQYDYKPFENLVQRWNAFDKEGKGFLTIEEVGNRKA